MNVPGAGSPSPTPTPLSSPSVESITSVPSALASPSVEVALEVRPGPATAARLDRAAGDVIAESAVARVDESGAIALDLGDLGAGAGQTPDGVLLLTALGADLHPSFAVDGDAAWLVADVALSRRDDGIAPAGTTTPLGITVRVPGDAEAGTVAGSLRIVGAERELAQIPLTLCIWRDPTEACPHPSHRRPPLHPRRRCRRPADPPTEAVLDGMASRV